MMPQHKPPKGSTKLTLANLAKTQKPYEEEEQRLVGDLQAEKDGRSLTPKYSFPYDLKFPSAASFEKDPQASLMEPGSGTSFPAGCSDDYRRLLDLHACLKKNSTAGRQLQSPPRNTSFPSPTHEPGTSPPADSHGNPFTTAKLDDSSTGYPDDEPFQTSYDYKPWLKAKRTGLAAGGTMDDKFCTSRSKDYFTSPAAIERLQISLCDSIFSVRAKPEPGCPLTGDKGGNPFGNINMIDPLTNSTTNVFDRVGDSNGDLSRSEYERGVERMTHATILDGSRDNTYRFGDNLFTESRTENSLTTSVPKIVSKGGISFLSGDQYDYAADTLYSDHRIDKVRTAVSKLEDAEKVQSTQSPVPFPKQSQRRHKRRIPTGNPPASMRFHDWRALFGAGSSDAGESQMSDAETTQDEGMYSPKPLITCLSTSPTPGPFSLNNYKALTVKLALEREAEMSEHARTIEREKRWGTDFRSQQYMDKVQKRHDRVQKDKEYCEFLAKMELERQAVRLKTPSNTIEFRQHMHTRHRQNAEPKSECDSGLSFGPYLAKREGGPSNFSRNISPAMFDSGTGFSSHPFHSMNERRRGSSDSLLFPRLQMLTAGPLDKAESLKDTKVSAALTPDIAGITKGVQVLPSITPLVAEVSKGAVHAKVDGTEDEGWESVSVEGAELEGGWLQVA